MSERRGTGFPLVTHRVMGVNGEAPACQPPTNAPSPHRATVDAAHCEDAGCGGDTCTEGCAGCGRQAGVESRHDVVGAHRSKERLSAPAQRGRAGLVVVSLQGPSHRYGKNWPIWGTVVDVSRPKV